MIFVNTEAAVAFDTMIVNQAAQVVSRKIFDFAPLFRTVRRSYEPTLAMKDDIVNMVTARTQNGYSNLAVKLMHATSTFVVRDIQEAVENKELLENLAVPAIIRFVGIIQNSIADALSNHGFPVERAILITRRLPEPMKGSGAISSIAEVDRVGFRVLMTYDSNTLGQEFHIDSVYGIAAMA